MNNIDEFRYDALTRDMVITERAAHDPFTRRVYIHLEIKKMDQPYDLNYSVSKNVDASVYGTDLYLDELRVCTNTIDEMIQRRHNSNPNHCDHDVVVSNNKKICTKCIAILGHTVSVDINYN